MNPNNQKDEGIETLTEDRSHEQPGPKPPGIYLGKDASVTISDGRTEFTIRLTPEQALELGINAILVAHDVAATKARTTDPLWKN